MRFLRLPALGAALIVSTLAFAQAPANPEKKLSCDGSNRDDRKRVCEMKEINLAATGRLDVDAGPNGGITVQGWSQSGVLVRARVEAWGDSESAARSTLGQVRVEAAGSQVRSTGPKEWMQQRWSVSYEVFVPQKSDLKLSTTNGGIGIADVRGAIAAGTTNGGLRLARLAGRVKAETTNGGINVELAGQTWDGESLEVGTTNGGVNLEVPASYAARIEAKTTNGGLSSDLPAQINGKSWGSKSMVVNANGGGPLIRVETTNGGVRVRQKNAA